MKWKKRLRELGRIRDKYKNDPYKLPFPDLSVEQRTAPTSDRLSTPPILKKEALKALLGPDFVVEHLHKSGYQVFHRKDLPNLGGKKL